MINDIPQPLWILKTAKEERLQRLVHMSADMARQVGIMLDNACNGTYKEVSSIFPFGFLFFFLILNAILF